MKSGRILKTLLLLSAAFLLAGCGRDIQIFEEQPITESVQVDASDMSRDKFYVKDGTKFASIYLPAGNAQQQARVLDTGRVLYFIDDEPMLPIHYKGEVLAYKSADISLLSEGVTLERYKDLGYSIGIFGGTVEGDGYYHFKISQACAVGSDAEEVFTHSQADDIRIVSVNGKKPIEIVEPNTGVFLGLEKDAEYTVEFYVGSYYYTYNFVADTHFLGAYEYYYYDGSQYVEDTKLSYMAFNTPEDLKSGYYNVNGTGLFLYHDYAKGNAPEAEDYNVGYYSSPQEQILQYTKQYNLNIPIETKDLAIVISYGTISDQLDEDCAIGGYLISPEGTIYDMTKDESTNQLEISLTTAMPGDWTIGIYPRSLEILGINTVSNVATEETVCEEKTITLEEDKNYQAVYADISGEGEVYGIIIADDGRTYQLDVVYYDDEYDKEQRYLVYRFPYLAAGSYEIKIYHYKSETSIENIQILEYNPNSNEFIIN